tara:strand:+ start:3789 stop:4487 length:699 start_codon:yes stop_codon:yes gene_type:complete
MSDFETLRTELRGLDGDLYLCHLFAPAHARDAVLTLYHFYADIARIPSLVSDPMVGAIRLQWWRDLLSALEAGETRGTPIGDALLEVVQQGQVSLPSFLPLIEGRDAALEQVGRNLDELEAEAKHVGPAWLKLACQLLGGEPQAALLQTAGTGFELMRLVPSNGEAVAARAHELLSEACASFNQLARAQRKTLLPVFLPIGLARRQAKYFPQGKSLLRYQISIMKMAFLGRL